MKSFIAMSAFHCLSVHAIDNLTNPFSKKVAGLENGAEVILDVVSPQDNSSTFYLDSAGNQEYAVPFEVTAHVNVGAPDVHYIYIMDTSGSTEEFDGPCGTTLQCIEQLFYQIHHAIRGDESAKVISFIEFDDNATTVLERYDPDSVEIGLTIMDPSTMSDGGTACSKALYEAETLVEKGEKTVIIFAGDGMCNDNAESAVASVESKGVIVHTIAVGDNINCTKNNLDPWSNVTLSSLTTSDGKCFDVPDPNDASGIVHELTLATLSGFEIKIDDNDYEDVDMSDLSVDKLPQDHPILVSYSKMLDFEKGEHDICFRATGEDVSNTTQVEDCRRVSIQDMPSAAPSGLPSASPSKIPSAEPSDVPMSPAQGFGTVATIVVVVVIVVGFIIFRMIKHTRTLKEKDTNASGVPEMHGEPEGAKMGEVVETGIPIV